MQLTISSCTAATKQQGIQLLCYSLASEQSFVPVVCFASKDGFHAIGAVRRNADRLLTLAGSAMKNKNVLHIHKHI